MSVISILKRLLHFARNDTRHYLFVRNDMNTICAARWLAPDWPREVFRTDSSSMILGLCRAVSMALAILGAVASF